MLQIQVNLVAALLLVLVVACSTASHFIEVNEEKSAWYLALGHVIKEMNSPFILKNHWIMFFIRMGTWVLLLTNFVPISLIVTFEMVKYLQAAFMECDADMIC